MPHLNLSFTMKSYPLHISYFKVPFATHFFSIEVQMHGSKSLTNFAITRVENINSSYATTSHKLVTGTLYKYNNL